MARDPFPERRIALDADPRSEVFLPAEASAKVGAWEGQNGLLAML
jgi:hypothetical protein